MRGKGKVEEGIGRGGRRERVRGTRGKQLGQCNCYQIKPIKRIVLLLSQKVAIM